jgi:hypothetical protein
MIFALRITHRGSEELLPLSHTFQQTTAERMRDLGVCRSLFQCLSIDLQI